MDQINGENNNDSPPTMPAKRKRGRPRKDKSIKRPKEVASRVNYPPQLNSVGDANDSLVGQPVTGVIEASFDAGFLLNVNIGNSGTCLRGFVFKPGHYCPGSAINDVAPHIQMIKRNEIPLPKENQNGGYNGNSGGMGNGQLLNNGSFSESATSKGKDREVVQILPFSIPRRDSAKPVVLELASTLSNCVSQNQEHFESMQSQSNGFSRRNETNKWIEVPSQSLEGHLESGNYTKNPHNLAPLPDIHSANSNLPQEAPQPSNNSRMGPMSMLLQAVQEKMMKPGSSS